MSLVIMVGIMMINQFGSSFVMTLSFIGKLEIGYISLEVKVRDLVNELCGNSNGID